MDQSAPAVEGRPLAGIGGWLILWAIGLVAGPIATIVGLVDGLSVYTISMNSAFAGLYLLHIVLPALFLVYAIFAAVQFFMKKKRTPLVMIVLIAINLAVGVILLLADVAAGDRFANAIMPADSKDLLRAAIVAAIWIPYFRVSKRVKQTFVR